MNTPIATLTDRQATVIAKLTQKMLILGASAKPLGNVVVGPIVSVYKFLATGRTRVSQIEALAPDFAVELGVEHVVVKRMPGDNAVGVFVRSEERRVGKEC